MGVTIGAVGSFALTRVMASLLFELSPQDPSTFVGTVVPLVVVALVACYSPARRATRVDPLTTLRHE